MALPTIPHTSKVWAIKDPPRIILHVKAVIPQFPAREYANKRYELQMAVAEAVGFRVDYDEAIIHWSDDSA